MSLLPNANVEFELVSCSEVAGIKSGICQKHTELDVSPEFAEEWVELTVIAASCEAGFFVDIQVNHSMAM